MFSDGAQVCALQQVVWDGLFKAGMCFGTESNFQKSALSDDVEGKGKTFVEGYSIIARRHNDLQITRDIPEEVSNYGGRPYLVFEAPDLVRDIITNFTNEEVKAIKHGLGSVNQLVESTDQLSRNQLVEMLKALYV
jgi:hypothetical protein